MPSILYDLIASLAHLGDHCHAMRSGLSGAPNSPTPPKNGNIGALLGMQLQELSEQGQPSLQRFVDVGETQRLSDLFRLR